ncbi:MAG: NAD(P)/FAD-dependent oxidoreductase [Flavobacteriales bacterium]
MNKSQSYPELLVIGGGFAGIALIKALRNAPYNITLIDKHNYHTFQPLLYQVASGGLGADAIGYPFRLIFRNQKNFNFRMAEVLRIVPEAKCVETSVGDFKYDYLVIASGSTTNFFGMKEVEKWSMPMKTIPEALDLRSDILQEFEYAHYTNDPVERARHMTFLVVGGGPTGVETAGALAEFQKFVLPHDYPELDKDLMKVYLVEAGPRLLAGMSEKSSAKAKQYLEQFGVKVLLNTAVTNYDGQEATLNNSKTIPTSTVIWAAGVKGQIIYGIPKESLVGNRIKVDAFNHVEGFDDIFALGDVAAMISEDTPRGHPMVAPVAVQQAKHLAKNLKRLSKSKNILPFLYKDNGSMATVGRNKAVVDLPWTSFGGFFAWLVWMFLHLMLLVGFRNRVVTFIDWTWNYFSYERALRLIVRTFDAEEVARARTATAKSNIL